MAIFAVPLGMPVKRPFVTTLKARGSAAFSHEAEDLVVFSPRLYKDVNSDLPEKVFMNKNLQNELLLSSSDSFCRFLRSRPLMLLPVLGGLIFLNPCCGFRKLPHYQQKPL